MITQEVFCEKVGYNISNIYYYICNFIGCQRRESTKEEVYKEFQKKIVTMSSYKCIAEIEASGNKSPHNYVFIHSYVKPDYYKLEVVEPKNLKGKNNGV